MQYIMHICSCVYAICNCVYAIDTCVMLVNIKQLEFNFTHSSFKCDEGVCVLATYFLLMQFSHIVQLV